MSTESIDPRYANYKRPSALQQRLDGMATVEGNAAGSELSGVKIAIIVGRWHSYIVDRLLQGALDTANNSGIADANIDVIQAPGAYEMPLVARALAKRNTYGALVTLGVIIKGDTPHFDFVAGECARGLSDVSRGFDLPIGFGVLTVNNVEQAMARAADGEANKGREAMLAALEVASLLKTFDWSNGSHTKRTKER